MPERYGPRTTVYNRYVRWGRKGVWKAVFDALAKEVKDSLIFIDGSIVKHTAQRLGQKGGTGRMYWPLRIIVNRDIVMTQYNLAGE